MPHTFIGHNPKKLNRGMPFENIIDEFSGLNFW